MRVQTTLMFETTPPEAMRFYHDELGATVVMEVPHWHDDESSNALRAAARPSSVTPSGFGASSAPAGRRPAYSISISTQTPEEADRLFSALAADGKIMLGNDEPRTTQQVGTLVDKFGTPWTLIP